MGYRYIGSKTQVLGKVLDKIKSLKPPDSHVTDLMCGTGTVSAALRQSGFRVTAADIMTFSYHHARVALLLSTIPPFRRARRFIEEHAGGPRDTLFEDTPYDKMIRALNNLPSRQGYFWREFSADGSPKNGSKPRNYFSPPNARKIDAIRLRIRKLRAEQMLTNMEHSLLLHNLIMAANDVANIAGTYGHYLSRLVGRARDTVRLTPTPNKFISVGNRHRVLLGAAEDLAGKIQCDLCYIDPPYMKRQYAANYHVLETLAREDEPVAAGVSGLRPWRDQYSNFCTKTKIRDSFRKVISGMRCPDFLVSYSEDGLLTRSQLTELLSEFGRVKTSTFEHKRFKSNDTKRGSRVTEYLFHLRVQL